MAAREARDISTCYVSNKLQQIEETLKKNNFTLKLSRELEEKVAAVQYVENRLSAQMFLPKYCVAEVGSAASP